jgi:CBS domain-containing membrane protein
LLELKVSELMSRELITLRRDESLNLAERVMQLGRVRHLPVVDGEHLVGLITHRDLLRAQVSALAQITKDERDEIHTSIRAEDIMIQDVHTVGPDDAAVDAARLMIRKKVGCVPVVDEGRLVGILTEADFLELAIRALG